MVPIFCSIILLAGITGLVTSRLKLFRIILIMLHSAAASNACCSKASPRKEFPSYEYQSFEGEKKTRREEK